MKQVIKKDSRTDNFDRKKLITAIWRAQRSIGHDNLEIATSVADKVIAYLELVSNVNKMPHVKQIRNITTQLLNEEGFSEVSAAYENFIKNETFWCEISAKVAEIEKDYGGEEKITAMYFKETLENEAFCPSREILRNFCLHKKIRFSEIAFALNSDQSIFDIMAKIAQIKKQNGSIGIYLSNFHSPQIIEILKYFALGIYFCENQNRTKLVIDVTHPQFLSILSAKEVLVDFNFFKLALEIPAHFLEAVQNNLDINIGEQSHQRKLPARTLFEMIADSVIRQTNISLIFPNNFPKYQTLSYKNIPLYDFESAAVGSIILDKLDLENNQVRANELLENATHFLYNCVLANEYLLPEVGINSKKNPHLLLKLKNLDLLLRHQNLTYRDPKSMDLCRELGTSIKNSLYSAKTEYFVHLSLSRLPDIPLNWNLNLAARLQKSAEIPLTVELEMPIDFSPQNCQEIIFLAHQLKIPAISFKKSSQSDKKSQQ